jgi:hypothetical protein
MRAAVATTAMRDPIKIFVGNANDEALLVVVVLKRKDLKTIQIKEEIYTLQLE